MAWATVVAIEGLIASSVATLGELMFEISMSMAGAATERRSRTAAGMLFVGEPENFCASPACTISARRWLASSNDTCALRHDVSSVTGAGDAMGGEGAVPVPGVLPAGNIVIE